MAMRLKASQMQHHQTGERLVLGLLHFNLYESAHLNEFLYLRFQLTPVGNSDLVFERLP
jgi:hypothetical protein